MTDATCPTDPDDLATMLSITRSPGGAIAAIVFGDHTIQAYRPPSAKALGALAEILGLDNATCSRVSRPVSGFHRAAFLVADMLAAKNRRYGNSMFEPVRLLSRADPAEQIRVRIDDKLSRIRSSQTDDDEDVVLDLTGYLLGLLMVQRGITP